MPRHIFSLKVYFTDDKRKMNGGSSSFFVSFARKTATFARNLFTFI